MTIISQCPAKSTPDRAASLKRLVEGIQIGVDTLGVLLSRPLTNQEHRQVRRAIGKDTYKDHRAHEIAQAHGWKRSWLMQSLTFSQIRKLAKVLDSLPVLSVIANRLDVFCDFRTATEDDGYAVDSILSGHAVVRPRRATRRLYRHRATRYHGRKWNATNFAHYCDERAAEKIGGPGCHSEIRIRGTSALKYYGVRNLNRITRANCIALFDKVVAWVEHGEPKKFDAAVESHIENRISHWMAIWDELLEDQPITPRERRERHRKVTRYVRRNIAKRMFSRKPDDDELTRTDWHRHPMQNALSRFPQYARKPALKSPFGVAIGLSREAKHGNEGQIRAGNRGGRRMPTRGVIGYSSASVSRRHVTKA